MFTEQVATRLNGLSGREPTRRWGEELIGSLLDLVGQCNANLSHRGPVDITNTHPSPDTPEDGEPALTLCTYPANDTLPNPDVVSLFVECGTTELQNLQVDGDATFNDCIVFNDNVIFNGIVSNRRVGWSSGVVRICLTGGFTNGCAPAEIIGATYNGSVGVCKPAYVRSGLVGAGLAINVIDRTGIWNLCAGNGWCGYAAYFQAAELATDCDLGATSAGFGWYEIIHLDPPTTTYTKCQTDVVTDVCCVNGAIVICTRTIYFSTPIREGAVDCGGSGSAICT